jgi:citrate/tricarballylate utilization protein
VSQLFELVEEAQRQLTICNACRYCEGFCSVWPALERRRELTDSDLTQLANLCHDCRDCLDACMYAAPHEFELNPPRVFSELRVATYRGGRPETTAATRRIWIVAALIAAAIAFTLIAGIDNGFDAIWQSHHGAASPYSVISDGVLLIAVAIPALWGLFEICAGAVRYWRRTATPLRGAGGGRMLRAMLPALRDAATLRNLGGGELGCTYPSAKPSGARKWFHHMVAYGFTCCVGSTVSAAIIQHIVGTMPPYPFISVPVLLGTVGGAGMALGCAGLIVLKRAAARDGRDPDRAAARDAIDPEMVDRDYAFIVALGALAITGLLVEVLRSTTIFGVILVIHLAVIAVCFAVAPYSKFVHAVYRYLALVQDHMEIAEEEQA